MLLATFFSGSLVTALIAFIGYRFVKRQDPLERQRAITETAILRNKALELVSSSNASNEEKALVICSIEQLPMSAKKSFPDFVDLINKFKSEQVADLIDYINSHDSKTYDVDKFIEKVNDLVIAFEKNVLEKAKVTNDLNSMIIYSYYPEEKLREVRVEFLEHVRSVNKQLDKEKLRQRAMDSYSTLVDKYDPYYYASATSLKAEFETSGLQSDLVYFINECTQLLKLDEKIVELIQETAEKVIQEPGFNFLDQNTINGWLSEIGNKDYMSSNNPTMQFNDDWQKFDSKRKALARKRGKNEIWALGKLSTSG